MNKEIKEDIENKFISFSIVIPAHNEELYIAKTIESLKQIDYPRDKLEIIIVENGSTDNTLDIIKKTAPTWFKIISIKESGVSKAKNVGIKNLSENSEWVIFLDADTYLGQSFLRDLSHFLLRNKNKNLGCGFVSLLPYPNTFYARLWYHFYNFANKVTKTTRSIQIIRRDLLKNLRFDENLTFDEDTMMIRACRKKAKYFFFKTKKVFSSTRRFERNGWIRQLFQWIYYASLPYEKKRKIKYKVLR